jgi:hypothetical protein
MAHAYVLHETTVNTSLQGRHIASEQGREYILHDAEAAEAAERAAAEQASKSSQELKQEEGDGSAALDISFELPSGALTGDCS